MWLSAAINMEKGLKKYIVENQNNSIAIVFEFISFKYLMFRLQAFYLFYSSCILSKNLIAAIHF